MTGEYTFVTPERQNELTRRIQEKLSEAKKEIDENGARGVPAIPSASAVPPSLATTALATTLVQ